MTREEIVALGAAACEARIDRSGLELPVVLATADELSARRAAREDREAQRARARLVCGCGRRRSRAPSLRGGLSSIDGPPSSHRLEAASHRLGSRSLFVNSVRRVSRG